MIRTTYHSLILVAVTLCSSLHATGKTFQPTPYETLATHLLPNTSPLKEDGSIISDFDAHKTALHILHTAHLQQGNKQEEVVDETTAQDLNLFFYSPHHPTHTMLHALKRTQTTLGTCQLGKLLLTPQTNHDELVKRQRIIRLLVENKELRESLRDMLSMFKDYEHQLLSLWNPNDPIYGTNISEMFYGGDIRTIRRSASFDASSYMHTAGAISGPLVTLFILDVAIKALTKQGSSPSKSAKIANALKWLFTAYGWYGSVAEVLTIHKVRAELLENIRTRFMGLRSLRDLITDLSEWSSENRVFAQQVSGMKYIHDFTARRYSQANRFLQNLSNKAFDKKTSTPGRVGPVLAALPQFLALKDDFCSALHTIAQLDAYLSIATLYNEFKKTPRGYCFAQFDNESETPRFSYNNFWHPSLPAEQAVPNTLSLGNNGQSRNVILTGPNAAGKSTISKAIVLTALLAQTFTIAPADSLELTPFSQINTYLNVVQDLGERGAHRAEVQRSKEIIDKVHSLPSHKFALTIIDEMYRNTNPHTGAAGSFGVAEGLGKLPNSLLILATHYSRLTALEKHTSEGFKNYKVEANKRDQGGFDYPYQIVPGANETVIVFDMMADEGFNDDILTFACEKLEDLQARDKGGVSRTLHNAKDLVDSYINDLRERIERKKRGLE
ncbi:MAG: hypothetical protein PVJ92_02820 [Candidatus Dependentiae bacterium]|jgi:DNA mismatch repair protein MutS